jgi:tRNA(Leu) C34 or U34 (ribose-2'-O)-methylase TrmL
MKDSAEKIQRMLRFLRRSKAGDFDGVADPRVAPVKHAWSRILECLTMALVMNLRTLREVEDFSEQLYGEKGRISDTTFDQALRTMDDAALQNLLIAQVRAMHRGKRLVQCEDMPLKILVLDGKNQATLRHDGGGRGHKRTSDTAKWFGAESAGLPYWIAPALRAVLVSTPSKPCVLQMALPTGSGESSNVPAFIDALDRAYGKSNLADVFMMDAGLTSLANAQHVTDGGYSYIMGVKENQSMLLEEARRLLETKAQSQTPEAATNWEQRGRCKIRRQIWRTTDMRNIETTAGVWGHLRETWLVRQETYDPVLTKTTLEDRYFITSVNPRRCTSSQCLNIVRAHWGVENDAFNSLDLQWQEDSGIWCTQGTAVWALGVLRLIAYNTAQFIRRKLLKPLSSEGDTPSWRRTFRAIRDAIEQGIRCHDSWAEPQGDPAVTG